MIELEYHFAISYKIISFIPINGYTMFFKNPRICNDMLTLLKDKTKLKTLMEGRLDGSVG